MKKVTIRLALLAIYLLVSLLNWNILPSSYDFFSSVFAIIFAIATTAFTGRAIGFVLLSVFIVTCAAPIAALSSFARSLHGSWIESVSSVVVNILTYNPLHGLELLFPLLLSVISLAAMQRWMNGSAEHNLEVP